MVKKEIRRDGLSIYYTVSGKGGPVIFIHGFGEDGRVWNEFREENRDFGRERFCLPGWELWINKGLATREADTFDALAVSVF